MQPTPNHPALMPSLLESREAAPGETLRSDAVTHSCACDAEGGDADTCALPRAWLPFPSCLPPGGQCSPACLQQESWSSWGSPLRVRRAGLGGHQAGAWQQTPHSCANTRVSVQEVAPGISQACTPEWACCLGGRQAGTKGDAEGSCSCKAGFGVLICSFSLLFPREF